MPRKVTLPGAAELFRATQPVVDAAGEAVDTAQPASRRRASSRVRHDEKITVYVSSDELLALEHARLELRAQHSLSVDRGRIVREAVALVLEDLSLRGADSELVRRLRES